MFFNPLLFSGRVLGSAQTVDVTTSQSCSTWGQINSASITQDAPSGTSVYYAVSFEGGSTYKAYQNSAWSTVTASASTWTKSEIEAMGKDQWMANGGWSSGVSSITWYNRLVSAVIADGSTNTSTTQAATGGTITASDYYGSLTPSRAFDGGTTTNWESSSTWPAWLTYQLPSAKIINKYLRYKYYTTLGDPGEPQIWYIYGSNNGSDWTQLDYRSTGGWNSNSGWLTYTFTNSTAYTYYKFYCTQQVQLASWCKVTELVYVEAQTTTPTFTKVTFNYNAWV